jgi:hypothetical protein
LKALAVAALLSLGARRPPEPKGLVLEQDTLHSFRAMVGMVTQEDKQRVYLSASGVRVESASGDGTPKFYTIFRFEPKGRVVRVEVNGFRKTYREEDLSERAAENEKLREALKKEAEKAKARGKGGGPGKGEGGLPLDLLAGGPGRPGGEGAASPVEVKETKDSCTIAGRRCRRVEFHQDGAKVFEAWYTEKASPAWARRFDIQESPGADNAPLLRARLGRKGLELRSILYLPAGGRAEVRTTKITEKKVAGALLEAPAGYRKTKPPGAEPKGGTRK